jgi:hypothetical protein
MFDAYSFKCWNEQLLISSPHDLALIHPMGSDDDVENGQKIPSWNGTVAQLLSLPAGWVQENLLVDYCSRVEHHSGGHQWIIGVKNLTLEKVQYLANRFSDKDTPTSLYVEPISLSAAHSSTCPECTHFGVCKYYGGYHAVVDQISIVFNKALALSGGLCPVITVSAICDSFRKEQPLIRKVPEYIGFVPETTHRCPSGPPGHDGIFGPNDFSDKQPHCPVCEERQPK